MQQYLTDFSVSAPCCLRDVASCDDDNLGGNDDNDDDRLSDFSDDNSDGQCGA